MAATTTWFGHGLLHAATDTHWVNDSIRVVLAGNGLKPDQDAHEFYAAVSAAELAAGNGYVTGGQLLANKSVTYDPATNQVRLLADPARWSTTPGGTIKARGAVIFKDTGDPATSPLLAWIDFGGNVSSTADIFSILFDTVGGVLRVTAQ